MDEIMIAVDSVGIEFLGTGYDLTWKAIENLGPEFWCDHLSRKTWITPVLLRRFRALAMAEVQAEAA